MFRMLWYDIIIICEMLNIQVHLYFPVDIYSYIGNRNRNTTGVQATKDVEQVTDLESRAMSERRTVIFRYKFYPYFKYFEKK